MGQHPLRVRSNVVHTNAMKRGKTDEIPWKYHGHHGISMEYHGEYGDPWKIHMEARGNFHGIHDVFHGIPTE